jgi:hypothetical protein
MKMATHPTAIKIVLISSPRMDGAADGTSTGVPRLYHIAANADLQSFAE